MNEKNIELSNINSLSKNERHISFGQNQLQQTNFTNVSEGESLYNPTTNMTSETYTSYLPIKSRRYTSVDPKKKKKRRFL